eukprot:900205_1
MVDSMSLSNTRKIVVLSILLTFLLGVHGAESTGKQKEKEITQKKKSQLKKLDIQHEKVGDKKNRIKLTWPKLDDPNISSYDIELKVAKYKEGKYVSVESKSISVKEHKGNDMVYLTGVLDHGFYYHSRVRPVWKDEKGREEDWVAIDPIVIGIDPFFVKLRYDKNGEELNSDKDRELLELMDKKARAYFE